MQYKQDSFLNTNTYGAFANCIPASGEGARRLWPEAKRLRQKKIFELKQVNVHWKSAFKHLRRAWEHKNEVESVRRRQDMESILFSTAELCMYSKAEKKWIQKNYRVFKKRLEKKKLRSNLNNCIPIDMPPALENGKY